jgi:hypothetical protein
VNDAERVAIDALRTAAQALVVDRAGDESSKVPESHKPTVASELAALFEALVHLLHSVDLDPVPRSGAGHSLHAIAQHVSAGAQLARRVAETDEFGPRSVSTHPVTRGLES